MTKFKGRLQGRIGALFIALLATIGMSLLVPGTAHAGTIVCGDGLSGFHNITYPSSQVHIWHPQLCSPYTDILTVRGDNVYLDSGGGNGSAYMTISPRVACDLSNTPTGPIWTVRNYSYTETSEYWLNFQNFYVRLCNSF